MELKDEEGRPVGTKLGCCQSCFDRLKAAAGREGVAFHDRSKS